MSSPADPPVPPDAPDAPAVPQKSLADVAAAAHLARLAAEAAALEEVERQVTAAARDAVKAVLTDPMSEPAQPYTFEELGMRRAHIDVAAGVAVWTDGTSALMAVRSGDGWTVRLTSHDAGRWRGDGPVVKDLSDIGAALADD